MNTIISLMLLLNCEMYVCMYRSLYGLMVVHSQMTEQSSYMYYPI